MPAVERDYPRALVVLTLDLEAEADPVDLVMIPRRVNVTRRPHTHADTAEVELDGTDLPLDPRALNNAVMTVHLGQGFADNRPWHTERTRRFIGYLDTLDTEQDDKDDTVSLKARDLSSALREVKPLPLDATPHYTDTLEEAIQRILDEVPGGEGLSLVFTDDEGDVPLASLVGGRVQRGPIHVENSMSAWGVIEYVAGLANRLVNVEVDRVVVRLPREVYANTQAPKATLVFNHESANLIRLATQKKFIRNRKGIRGVSWDPITRTKLVVDYPPDNELPPRRRPTPPRSTGRGRARRRAAPKPPERDVFPVQGVTTREGLLNVVRGIWQERSRQEIGLSADTPYFTEEFLDLRNGDRVRVQLNRALAAGLNTSQTRAAQVAFVRQRLGVEAAVAELLVNAALHPGADLFYAREIGLQWSAEGDIGAKLDLINMIAVGREGVS